MAAFSIKRLTAELLLSTIGISVATHAFAAAWTQAQGNAQVITTVSSYVSDAYYDRMGHRQKQNSYAKQELSAYAEYGLRDWLTLGGSASLTRATQNDSENWGLSDSDLFARIRLWQGEGAVFSVAPIAYLPSPTSRDDDPILGSATPSGGVQLSAGYGFEAWGNHHFAAVDNTYIKRMGDAGDQWHMDMTLGIGISSDITLMPQLFLTRKVGGNTRSAFTQSASDDYDLSTARLSVVYAVSDKLSVQVGAYQDINGNNAGKGTGALIALWRNF